MRLSNMWRDECRQSSSKASCIIVTIPEDVEQDGTVSFEIPYEAAFSMREGLSLGLITQL